MEEEEFRNLVGPMELDTGILPTLLGIHRYQSPRKTV